jgi:hypothetical protein
MLPETTNGGRVSPVVYCFADCTALLSQDFLDDCALPEAEKLVTRFAEHFAISGASFIMVGASPWEQDNLNK